MCDIKYVVCGIAFNHSFSLLDNWGKIADDILYRSKHFSSEFFTNISTQYTTERTLQNPETGDFLRLSANNLIFKYYIKDDFEKEYKEFCKKINEYLVPKILSEYALVIRRLGVVFAQELLQDDLNSFSKKYFRDEVEHITDFRFAQKELTNESRLWHGVEDYLNKVYTFGKIGDNKTFDGITYDFQVYFNPPRADVRDVSHTFLTEGLSSFKKDILNTVDSRKKANGKEKEHK